MKKQRFNPWLIIMNFVMVAVTYWLWTLLTGMTASFGDSLAFGALYLGVQLAIFLAALPVIAIMALIAVSKERRSS